MSTFPAATRPRIADLLTEHAGRPDLLWGVDLAVTERSWRRLDLGGADAAAGELWLIVWPVGASTGWHDHGSASGAFLTLRGRLTEHSWNGSQHVRTLEAGQGRHFGDSHVHDVVNDGAETAVSLHGYAPSLAAMTRYELVRGRLVVTGVEHRGDLW
jgi:hypothetical protein